MIASLPMYHRSELVHAHETFWQCIAQRLNDAGVQTPQHLDQTAIGLDAWLDPDLVFSQTCGMPYRLKLHQKVTLIGTPDYGLAECPPGHYRSPIVVRKTDPRDQAIDFRHAIFAYNEKMSQSGYAAPQVYAANRGFQFDNLRQSGGHFYSAQDVASGHAEIASLDAVSWRLMQRYDAFAQELRVLDWTPPTPGLPFITAKGADQALFFAAVKAAIATLSEPEKSQLGIRGLIAIPAQAYLGVPNP